MNRTDMTVMSFNIRYAGGDSGTESWEARIVNLIPLVKKANPDLIGFQEALHPQYIDLKNNLSEYDSVGVGREDGKQKGEHSAIFYKKDRFLLLDVNHFWLSLTPEKPSFGWDAACIRICTYVRLKDKKTNNIFVHFNAHLDHVGKVAMLEGAKLMKKFALEQHLPAIITGDFNATEDTETYREMASNGTCDAKYTAKETMSYGTFHGYRPNEKTPTKSPIDYVFYSENDFDINSYEVLVNGEAGAYTSDHYPVLVNLTQKG